VEYLNEAQKNIYNYTQNRKIAAGSKTIASTVSKYLSIDSLTNGAEILGVVIKGVVSAQWTLKIYIPAVDTVASPAAGDLKDTIIYESTDTFGGSLKGFFIPFNCFLSFTNDSVSSDDIDEVEIQYRSVSDLTVSWEA
jgi:mannose/fructose/N-acetylgalactosamine-specific phosphotransferase system component IID